MRRFYETERTLMDYREREKSRWLRMLFITVISIAISLLITFLILLATRTEMMPIIFIIATIAPAVTAPIVSWSISGLMIKVQKLEETHRKLAMYDHLTGLLSRREFLAQGNELLQMCQSNNQPVVFAYLDLDHFKKINDTYGHAAGDEVLVSFANLVKKTLRQEDLLGRLGGEEFALILVNTRVVEAKQKLELLRKSVAKMTINYAEQQLKITVSLGVADWDRPHEENLISLMKRADNALYSAKSSGRNQLAFAKLF